MATVASGLNSGVGYNDSDTITSTNLNLHVNDATVIDIANGDIALNAAIAFTKLAPITSQKVLGSIGSGNAEIDIVGTNGILKNDDALGTSDTQGATQGNIKAYVDGGGGFTPSSYANEESVTLPNGLIMKMGKTSVISDDSLSSAISFGTPFNAVPVSIVITKELGLQTGGTGEMTVTDVTASSFKIANGGFAGAFYFQAIGR